MLPTSPSWAGHLRRVDVEIPAVIRRGELVPALLLKFGRVAALEVIADGCLHLARGRVQAKAEDARAHVGVETPGRHVQSAALAEERYRVAVRGRGDLGRAQVGHRQGWRRGKTLDRKSTRLKYIHS